MVGTITVGSTSVLGTVVDVCAIAKAWNSGVVSVSFAFDCEALGCLGRGLICGVYILTLITENALIDTLH